MENHEDILDAFLKDAEFQEKMKSHTQMVENMSLIKRQRSKLNDNLSPKKITQEIEELKKVEVFDLEKINDELIILQDLKEKNPIEEKRVEELKMIVKLLK